MSKVRSCGLATVICVVAFSPTATPQGVGPHPTRTQFGGQLAFEPRWRQPGDCGPMSLFVLMRMNDHAVSLSDVNAVLHVDSKLGCSLADVARAADALSFAAEVRFVKPQDLSRLPFPFILHTTGSLERGTGHFLVVLDYMPDKQEYHIIDTEFEDYRAQSEESILQGFDGYVLITKDGFFVSQWRCLFGGALVVIGCVVAIITFIKYPMFTSH